MQAQKERARNAAAVENGVDDSAGVTDGDALACAVPTGVHEVGLRAALLHFLHHALPRRHRTQLHSLGQLSAYQEYLLGADPAESAH